MGKDLYDSIISKIALVAPMFAKAIVDISLEKAGVTAYDVTPAQMKKIIKDEIVPRLDKYIKTTQTLETIGGGRICFDNECKISSINPAARRLTGLPPQAHLNDSQMSEVINKLNIRQQLTAVLTHETDVVICDVKLTNPNVWLNIIGGPIQNNDAVVTGAVFFLQDSTLKTALETEVDQVYEKLEQEHKEKEKLHSQLLQKEKMSAVGQLASGIAHEINNPMGVILGFAQVIVKDVKKDNPLFIPLKSIEKETIRCKQLINDLLIFSRLNKPIKEATDINNLIETTLSFVQAQAKVKNITITKEFGHNLPQIMANKNQLQQVIVNLCNNSIDSMPNGGEIVITTRNTGNQIEFSVTDTGMGMTKETKQHLFEPFFTTKDVGKGTGLGLSLCYEIIHNHNGVIEATSEPDKGTVVNIKLPIQ
jgi:signal transduction histidine kinase